MEHFLICRDVAYLCKCAVEGVKPDLKRVANMDIDAIFSLSNAHMITATVALALESVGYKDERFHRAIAASQRKTVIFENALDSVRDGLIERDIWFMPLKGAILKDYYPQFGMREFSDYDILIDDSRAADVRKLMEDIGFTPKHEFIGVRVHDIYHKSPVLNYEMHRSLFGRRSGKKLYDYYQNIEMKLTGEGCEKRFETDDFYVYMIAHEYRHYSGGGTGIRSLLDTYVFLKKVNLNMDYVSIETEKLGIADFEKKNRLLAFHLFDEGSLSSSDCEMLEYILLSGTYGTFKNGVENGVSSKGRARFVLSRLFLPYDWDLSYTQEGANSLSIL